MIYSNIDANKYKEDFKARFTNFGEKAPIILSFAIDDLGVTVIHENSGKQYFYEWDYSISVKSLIHLIKQDLSHNHYPRLAKKEKVLAPTTSERAAEMIAQGMDVNKVPASEVVEKEVIYRIDKILAMKDEFILVDEATGKQYLYKMNSSGIYFLKNYREGTYKDIYEAGDAFFKKSRLLNILDKPAS
jgi:hypothetical protein